MSITSSVSSSHAPSPAVPYSAEQHRTGPDTPHQDGKAKGASRKAMNELLDAAESDPRYIDEQREGLETPSVDEMFASVRSDART